MLKIEPHKQHPDQQVCVWYDDQHPERCLAVVYVDERRLRMKVIHEAEVAMQGLRRVGQWSFEDISDSFDDLDKQLEVLQKIQKARKEAGLG